MSKEIDLKNLPPAAKFGLAFVPAIIVAVIFFYVGIKPKMVEIEKLKKAITKVDNEIKTNEVKVRKLAELKKKNAELQRRLADLKRILPDEREVSVLLKQVSDLGVESGLEIISWKPEKKSVASNGLYVEIPVKVEMIGGFHNLGKFYSKLSCFERIVNVLDINMKPSTQSQGKKKDNIWRNSIAFKAMTYSSVSEEEGTAGKKDKSKNRRK